MNVVKCSNGHFFDGDMYQVCPHCGAPVGVFSQTPSLDGKEKRKGLFGKKDKVPTVGAPFSQIPGTGAGFNPAAVHYTPQMSGGPAANYIPVKSGFGDGKSARVDIHTEGTVQTPPAKKNDPTLAFWQTGAPAQISSNGTPDQPVAPNEQPEQVPAPAPEKNAPPITGESPETKAQEPVPPKKSEPLLETVQKASATAEGKTLSYFSAVTDDASAQKPKTSNPSVQTDPVVGWLVCIHGEHFGESFTIGAGMNSIGRNEGNRIVLDRDRTISREKHTLITYEPKHRQFYVKPGESSGLTYVNDEYITETKLINAGDRIELGNCKFLFVPLCGDSFTWEDYMRG